MQDKILKLLTAFLLILVGQVQSAEKVTYYFNDVVGSPVQSFDHNGTEVWSESYSPYGDKLVGPAENKNDVGFTGHQSDDGSGLVYMQARYYDPEIGRFYSIDPIDFHIDNIQTFNRYAYANNNPYKFIDPDGKAAETVWDAISLSISFTMMVEDPSWTNFGWLVLDTAATIIPGAPGGAGTFRAGNSASDQMSIYHGERISGSYINHVNGAIGEWRGWYTMQSKGHIGIEAPKNVSAPGVDFITFDTKTKEIVFWDAKYRVNGNYPVDVPAAKANAWLREFMNKVNDMPEGPLKIEVIQALQNNQVRAEIFKWPG